MGVLPMEMASPRPGTALDMDLRQGTVLGLGMRLGTGRVVGNDLG